MRVVHQSGRVLASDVETADGPLAQGRGLMFRRSVPEDYALVFRFGSQRRRGLHMLFVPFPIDACWTCDGVVQQVTTLRSWVGYGRALADTVVEAPAGAFDGVEAGDRVRVEE
ncbi:DUF192 domain-containing protein [Halomarina oriensis]|uniref:DUF192 domain-containing protein n=1 Tax=Halomarina oriensis TaxID=671145 RepID=A0A6B0GKZ9_9EURY|nr:DUF192 domain-containing protein [Halomarina oriensis]MWG35542.1 DUF192 domain-containing protein [Halomarina oriensis]